MQKPQIYRNCNPGTILVYGLTTDFNERYGVGKPLMRTLLEKYSFLGETPLRVHKGPSRRSKIVYVAMALELITHGYSQV